MEPLPLQPALALEVEQPVVELQVVLAVAAALWCARQHRMRLSPLHRPHACRLQRRRVPGARLLRRGSAR